ncbi:MAG TPA: helix-turn-helix transcriptional regulator, partial [Candidatus Pullilachnospira intestinigallinarum]|nr:helix-turn-helix transcriptional regulator [Candidatus Pullilachnospira intestinigallinarum]
MAISYKKLFKLMIDKDMKKKDLRTLTGVSYSTLLKMENGEYVSLDVLDRICRSLHCQLSDIAEVLPDACSD